MLFLALLSLILWCACIKYIFEFDQSAKLVVLSSISDNVLQVVCSIQCERKSQTALLAKLKLLFDSMHKPEYSKFLVFSIAVFLQRS